MRSLLPFAGEGTRYRPRHAGGPSRDPNAPVGPRALSQGRATPKSVLYSLLGVWYRARLSPLDTRGPEGA